MNTLFGSRLNTITAIIRNQKIERRVDLEPSPDPESRHIDVAGFGVFGK
jgi:hypothetical protein